MLYYKKKGFSLVELLVVISIIALLTTILLSVLSRAKEAARTVGCDAHLRQIGVSLNTYTAIWEGALAGPCTSGTRLSKSTYGDSIDTPNEYEDIITAQVRRLKIWTGFHQ